MLLMMLLISAGSMAQADSVANIRVEVKTNDSVYKAQTVHADAVHADSTHADSLKSQGRKILEGFNESVPTKPKDVFNAISFSKIFWTVILLLIGYYLTKLSIKILDLVSEKSVRLRITIKSIIPVARIIIWTIIIFAIVKGIYNPPFETVIAVTASVGIAIGLASQDLLKNVFGGIALLIDRPFQVGDKIEAGKYYGEVIEIGLRATRIVTADDSTVSVPNAELMNSSVSNSNSGELNCQVVAEIYLPVNVDTQMVRKIAIEAAQVSRFVYLNKPIVAVFFNEVVEVRPYLKLRLKAYVLDVRYEAQFKSDMTEITIRELIKAGIPMES
jgi:small-conductance mechanosensitive channel